MTLLFLPVLTVIKVMFAKYFQYMFGIRHDLVLNVWHFIMVHFSGNEVLF